MLGRLLHLGSDGSASPSAEANHAATSRPILSLESKQEDIHTRNLLFPDAQALYQHRNDQVFPLSSTPPSLAASSTATPFDYDEDVDLDVKDVRILVMQDALGPANASLLLDSHSPPESDFASAPSPIRQDTRRVPLSSTRRGSFTQSARPFVIQAESPQPRQGAFDRRSSVHSRTQSNIETEAQRASREYREELATFSSCIFGNSELMAYKGTSTKVHVVPSDSRAYESAASSVFGDGRSSVGRSSARSSKLSQSCSSQAMSPIMGTGHPTGGIASPRQPDKRKVLITRLFPVTLTVDGADPDVTPQNRFAEEGGGFPFPATSDESPQKKKKPQPKQRRTPMYAVVLVIHIPHSASKSSSAPSKPLFRESASDQDQDLLSSSYNSAKAGWNMSGSGTFGDVADSSDIEDRIDALTRHWDIIMRTLTHLQGLVTTNIHAMLKQADIASPGPYSGSSGSVIATRRSSMSDRRSGELPRAKPAKSTVKLVSLWPNCLADDVSIATEVGLARSRIVMGLSAARVITGQGRWGIWRDEAIWTSKWAASTNRNAFFHNLLTGFLSTHTQWLQALCGSSYRKRAGLSRRNENEEDLSLPARTVVISDDKMAARRLVFLLSAFLPANQQSFSAKAHRPSTSASVGGYSSSPPTFAVPALREESLRRKINRRTGLRHTSHSRRNSQSSRNPTMALPQFTSTGVDRNHQRRESDAGSIRTTSLPLPGADIISRKSSAATTTTIMPETTAPHFTSVQYRDYQRRSRPGSSGSVAADDLKRSLKRGDSSGQAGGVSRPPSVGLKWGSLIGGFWGPRRRESLDNGGTYDQGNAESRPPGGVSSEGNDKLSAIVRESPEERAKDLVGSAGGAGQDAAAADTGQDGYTSLWGRRSFARADQDRTPDPAGAFESRVKTTINAEDGVIDVDVPFPDYITSFESAISSPSSSGYLSTPGLPNSLEIGEQARFVIEGDLPLNAAGWLNRFHPDFALQALPPQDDLMDQLKTAMRAEPTPSPLNSERDESSESWVDIGCVLIADTTSSMVRRLVHRRLVRTVQSGTRGSEIRPGGDVITPSFLRHEAQLEEEWIEEPILTCDYSLKEAVDKIIDIQGDFNKDSSMNSSRNSGDVRGSLDNDSTMPDALSETTQTADASLDTPRVQCRTVILSVLEELFREAVDNLNSDRAGRRDTQSHGRQRSGILRDAVRDWVASMDAVA